MNVEAKVGAFTVGGLMLLGASVIGLGNFNFGSDNDYILYAGFRQVIGLEPQATVRLSGVPIGTVKNIANDGGGVTVTMDVKPNVKIPKNSKVTIASSGVMGEKFVNILPAADNGNYLENGDYLFGVDEMGMDSMFESLNKVMDRVETLLISANEIVGDKTFQKSVVDMSQNMKQASEHMNGLMASLERISTGNEGNVNQIMEQMNSILRGMNATMANVEHMTTNLDKFAGDPQTVADLKTTLTNISNTSKNIANMAENMNKVAGDPKVAEDMKATISNARSLTERADKMLGKVQGKMDKVSKIDVTPSVDVLYSGSASNWNTNFNLNVTSGKTSLDVGAEDIGDHTKFNAQVGKRFNDLGARAGIIAGKPGVGLDAYAGSKWKFSAEAYDPNDAKLRLKSQYKVAKSTYILGEWHDVTDNDNRAAYVGIKQEF